MAKNRRSAIDDVLGSESPILGALARQLTSERPVESGGGGAVQEEQKPTQPPKEPRPQRPARTSPKRAPVPSRATGTKRAKRMLVSPEEETTLDELVMRISGIMGARVQYSHLARAMWEMLLDAEATFDRVSAPRLERPANQDQEAIAEFEGELKAWLIDVIQRMPRRQR